MVLENLALLGAVPFLGRLWTPRTGTASRSRPRRGPDVGDPGLREDDDDLDDEEEEEEDWDLGEQEEQEEAKEEGGGEEEEET